MGDGRKALTLALAITGLCLFIAVALVTIVYHDRTPDVLLFETSVTAAITTVTAFPVALYVMRQHVRLQRALAELEIAARRDGLTGVANRGAFLELVGRMVEQPVPAPEARVGTMLMLDVDHFKRVNDRHGHAVGDQVLIGVAERLRSAVRGGDVVGRIGGEEFAVFLPRASAEAGRMVAERLRAAVAAEPLGVPGRAGVPVTVSIGIAEHQAGQTLADLLKIADDGLYRAKRAGRDRVVDATPQTVGELAAAADGLVGATGIEPVTLRV